MDEFLDSFTPESYRELLASERLDPDPLERLIVTLQLGFSTLASIVATAASGQSVEIPPKAFDPLAHDPKPQRVSPNQVRNLVASVVPLL